MLDSPHSVFLELPTQEYITYEQANAITARIANRLTELQLKPGDRITAQIEKSPEAVLLYLACLRAGIIFHPLNTAYTHHELEHFVRDAQPSLIVCTASNLFQTNELASRYCVNQVLTLETDGSGSLMENYSSYSAKFDVVDKTQDETAILVYTSGTTGLPKGAMITHGNLSSNAIALCDTWEWTTQDVMLHVLPLFHVHGLCFGLHTPMMKASRIIFHLKFSVSETLKRIPDSTVLMAVPTIYTRLLTDSELTPQLCKDTRVFISGSAPLLPETFKQFEERTGHRILERYGMTEAAMVSSNPIHGDRIPGTVGRPINDVTLRVRDDSGEILENGQIGVLEISGPNIFSGYWRNDSATREAFRDDGFFVTGDLAKIDENGVLSIVGRESDLIISAGLNIYPREVEIQLNKIPGVVDSAVIGVPHPDLGEGVFGAVILNKVQLSENQILEILKGKLSAFKIPKKIVQVPDFPRNAMGKVEKKQLRIQYQSAFEAV